MYETKWSWSVLNNMSQRVTKENHENFRSVFLVSGGRRGRLPRCVYMFVFLEGMQLEH